MNKKIIACPSCKKKFSYFDSKHRPFCTERCKMIDLGRWFEESYKVSSPPETVEEWEEIEKAVQERENKDNEKE